MLTVQAKDLPIKIDESFTKKNQELTIIIKNFKGTKISTKIVAPQNRNLRFNQIKLPNGHFDGPFSQEIKNYKISSNGEVWLIIGKDLMAEGVTTGKFTVLLSEN